MNFAEWSAGEHVARVVNLSDERALPWLLDTYGGVRPRVLQSVLSHGYSVGARTAIIEYRYIDLDWRNEHKAFYTSTFRRYPSVAHRLHFFKEPPPADLRSQERPALIRGMTYLGYTVLRPVPAAPVGRTFLRARQPATLTCSSKETANLFGTELNVDGTGFIAQDAQLSRCAQTTTWVTAYHHHRRFGGPRALPGDIADLVAASSEHGRPIPSPGLTIGQIADAARGVGLPPLVYPLRHLPEGETIPRVVCRYLNSSLPVTVTTHGHAFALVGYGRRKDEEDGDVLYFVRHDDEVGPYQEVDWRLDSYGAWEYAIVPLPEKVYLAGENAEAIGSQRILDALEDSADPRARDLAARYQQDDRPLSFRTTVVLSNEFKTNLDDRLYPERVATGYQRMQMSRFVWVVELTDNVAREAGQPCVLAEAVIDATDHIRDLHVLGWRVPGAVWAWVPDDDEQETMEVDEDVGPTHSVAHPHPY